MGAPAAVSDIHQRTLVGRLLWFTGGVRWLWPWMSVWFRMAAKPTLRFQHLDRDQLAELSGLLDGAWRVSRHAALSDVRQGWQSLEICGRAVSDREDILSPAWKNGRVWLKAGRAMCSSSQTICGGKAGSRFLPSCHRGGQATLSGGKTWTAPPRCGGCVCVAQPGWRRRVVAASRRAPLCVRAALVLLSVLSVLDGCTAHLVQSRCRV